jgi:Tol biopolymer transport system component
MPLGTGARLGSYEIVAKLGEGGMGEVYRAKDTTLDREVAIKVLPESFAADADRVARFTREAKTLAALNHPHIAQIYGIEQSAGVRALVMELVEGEDLSQVIARGALPLTDALPIAKQIALALEAAHEAGIIHRDLKPANVKIRQDGTVKVLDFGLAKALGPEGVSATADAMNSPTLTNRATQLGMIIGTAAYMAPEQAKGRAVDKRADIWAFGVVLFELLTGRRAFAGDDVSETLASVLKEAPALDALPPGTPPRLRELIARCLQKDPRVRQRDIGDANLELAAIAAGRIDHDPAAPSGATRGRAPWSMVAGVALAAAALGIAIGRGVFEDSGAAAPATARFVVGNPPGGPAYGPALTSDGRQLIFVTDRLYKRDLSGFAATPVPGTEGASTPMVSPDGRWAAFFAGGRLKKVSLAGGDPTTIAEVGGSMPGAAWIADNTIVLSRGWATGLSSIQVDTGQIEPLTEPDPKRNERAHWRPRPLPGGQQILFTIWMRGSGINDARIGLLDLASRQHRALFPGTDGMYLHSGHILYFRAGSWHVVPFDAMAGKVTGDPITVLDDAIGITPDGGGATQMLAVSETGHAAYAPGPLDLMREFVWIDRTGKVEPLGLPARRVAFAALSPDGRFIATSRAEGGYFEIWMNDVIRRTEDRLDIKGNNLNAIWSQTGDEIAFVSERKGEYDAYASRPDGSAERPLLTKDIDEQPLALTRDGRRLIVKEWLPDGSTPVSLVDLGAGPDHRSEVLFRSMGLGIGIALSRDDRWMAFAGLTSGRRQILVQAVRAGAVATRVSRDGGAEPFWSPSGTEIFFHANDALVSVPIRAEGERVVAGSETTLFPLPPSSILFGVAPDGRFLVARLAEPEPTRGIRVVLHWFEELKKAKPVR